MIDRLAQIRGADDGATAVEMALVMMAALILILGMIEFALAYWTMHTLLLAVEETGRYVMIHNTDSNITSEAESYMQQYMPGSSTTGCTSPAAGEFCVDAQQSTSNNTNTMTLTASYGFDLIGLTGTIPLVSQNTVPLD